jgi:CRISPR-associated protein Cst2
VVDQLGRQSRAQALVQALAATLLKPTGAQRNTQNPHLVACEGVVTTSSTSLPAPTVSPLHDNYREQIEQTKRELNKIKADGVTVRPFTTLADGVGELVNMAANLQVPEAPNNGAQTQG